MLIATRNRPNEVQALLASLVGQEIDQIVVSASGVALDAVLQDFIGLLNLTYIKSEAGQIRQKMSGIKALRSDLDWVIFSDDDVEYPSNFIEMLKRNIKEFGKSSLSGIGFHIVNGKSIPQGKIRKFVNAFFLLQSGQPGTVKPSGDCIPYLSFNEPTATMWLNGASAWRYKQVLSYSSPVPETKYAAYEDALFSFRVFATGELIYIPELQLRYQIPDNQTILDALIFESYLLWKLFFVIKFKLSIQKFLWSSVGLSLLFLTSKNTQEKIARRFKVIKLVWRFMIEILRAQDREKSVVGIIRNHLPKA
jgi:glycosyltransferase involved in cell wall biosynthesis